MFRRSFLIYVVTALLFVTVAYPTSIAAAGPDFAKVDEFMEEQMRAMRIPGVALAIVKGDTIVYMKGYGQAGPDGRPVTPQTPFLLGSLSKSFTTLAVMQLVEAGQVDLDAPVQRYIPTFQTADADAGARITVRHLLNQVSGISTAAGQAQFAGGEHGTMAQIMRDQVALKLTAAPGERFQYSNYNYTLLGLVIEHVSGQSYEEYIQKHIFAPLQMTHSYADQVAAERDHLSAGHRIWFGLPVSARLPYFRGSVPAGYLISSAQDMAHYLIAQLQGGRYGNASLLSSEGIAELHRPAAALDDGGHYGMGWFVEEFHGLPVVWHSGDVPNYHADMVLVPDGEWGILMLSNANTSVYGMGLSKRVAADLTALVVKGEAPARGFTLITWYWILDLVAVLIIGWQVFNLARLRRQGRPTRWQLVRGVLNLVLALLIGLGLPAGAALPWSVLFLFFPDVALLVAVACTIGFLTGLYRLWASFAWRARTEATRL